MKRVPRRERERERHRQEILDAARRVLAERGLGGLTVEEVARQAEFAVGSIYRHFRSKEELVEWMVVDLIQPGVEEIEQITARGGPFEDQLRGCVDAVMKMVRENLAAVQEFHAAPGPVPGPGTVAGDRLREARRRYFEAVDRLVENGQREGTLPPGDPRPMTLALVGLLFGFIRGTVWGLAPEGLEVSPLVVRAFLHGFAAGGPPIALPSPPGRPG
jgi:AcrR family transcriptional regulator